MSILFHRLARIVTVSLATLIMTLLGCVTAELRAVNSDSVRPRTHGNKMKPATAESIAAPMLAAAAIR